MSDGTLRKITSWVKSRWWPHHHAQMGGAELPDASVYFVTTDLLDTDGDLDLLPIIGELFEGAGPQALAGLEAELDAAPVFPCRWLSAQDLAEGLTFTLRLGRKIRRVRLARSEEMTRVQDEQLLFVPQQDR